MGVQLRIPRRDQDEEHDQRDDGDHHDEDPGEEARVGVGAVHGVVLGRTLTLTRAAPAPGTLKGRKKSSVRRKLICPNHS